VPTLVYGFIAVAFGVVFFRHPAGDGPPLGKSGN
jgi:hypothetical protein